MKLSTLLVCAAILALAGCENVNDTTQAMKFTQHKQTGLCFSVVQSELNFTNVPCTPAVLALVNGGPVIPPVIQTENVR